MPVHIQETPFQQQPPRLNSTNEGTKSAGIMRPVDSQSYAPPIHAPPVCSLTMGQDLQPLKMTSLQSEYIAGTMEDLRERVAKRQKIGDAERVMLKQAGDERESSFYSGSHGDSIVGGQFDDADSIISGQFDILEELDKHPHVIQIVATAGGLIVHWNEEFTKITKPSASLREIPLSIFELVDSKSVSPLYSMLALSLHNIAIDKVENFYYGEEERSSSSVGEGGQNGDESTPSSHLTVSLPCKLFPASPIRYNITVVFMNDTDSNERCFLGILTPRSKVYDGEDDSLSSHESCACLRASSKFAQTNVVVKDRCGANEVAVPLELPCGSILRIDDELLCRILCGNAIK